MKRFNILLRELNKAHNIKDFSPDESDTCWLTFREDITIRLQYIETSEQITLLGIVGDLPKDNKEQVTLALLQENLDWKGTGGGTFSVSPDNERIYLGYKEDIQATDITRLQTLLTRFVENCDAWKQHIIEIIRAGSFTTTNTQSTNYIIRG